MSAVQVRAGHTGLLLSHLASLSPVRSGFYCPPGLSPALLVRHLCTWGFYWPPGPSPVHLGFYCRPGSGHPGSQFRRTSD